MLQAWIVIASALCYIGLLFVIASYGDQTGRGREGNWRGYIYPLSLAIYCTSWTFFGSVGLASRTGFDFLTIYVGPMLVIGLGSPLIRRIVRLAKAQNITSIADFIAARYGKAQSVAATVALIAIIGTVPYIALQLKAVSASLTTILVHSDAGSGVMQPVLGDIALYVAAAMALFAILFGTRHIDATEHQDGLMLAIATESLVKLVAFVAVGVFVTFSMFDGPFALFAQALERPETAAALTREPSPGRSAAMTLLSLFAIVLLPRQFHVTVGENNSEDEIKRASWLFPFYLLLINLFVVPIALAGLLTFSDRQVDSDMFVLALPLAARSEWLTIAAFVGGFSAATAMVIVESVALAIMFSNDIVMPLVLQRREALISWSGNVGGLLLIIRRVAIFLILLLAYVYYRMAGDAQLASIGLLSFAAIAQLAPAFFGGLVWRGATARGALAGMITGILVWAYTLLLPSFAAAGIAGEDVVTHGPWGLSGYARNRCWNSLPPLAHGVIWGLSLNVLGYFFSRLSRAPAAIERLQADLFVPSDLTPIHPGFRLWRSSVTVEELSTTVARYLGEERTRTSLASYASTRESVSNPKWRLTSSCCVLPSIYLPRPSERRPLVWCCRSFCASARCRQKRPSSFSTMPMLPFNTIVKSCRLRSTMSARALRYSIGVALGLLESPIRRAPSIAAAARACGHQPRSDPALQCGAKRLRAGKDRCDRERAAFPLYREWSAVPRAVRRSRPCHGSTRQPHARREHRDDVHGHYAEREGGGGA